MRNRNNNEVLLAINIDAGGAVDQKPGCHLEWPYDVCTALIKCCSLCSLNFVECWCHYVLLYTVHQEYSEPSVATVHHHLSVSVWGEPRQENKGKD